MYIPNRILATCYRLITAAIAGLATFFIFHSYGSSAFRFFPTWVAIIAAVYFFCSGVATYFSVQRSFFRAICPTLQGALIIAGITLLILQFVCFSHNISIPSSTGLIGTLVNFVLPLLFLFDWLLFSEKGFWRPIDPLYWLALPTCFVAVSLIIIQLTTHTDSTRFVYPFFDYPNIGFDTMLWYFAIAAVLILIFGYLCFFLDFAISGRLGQYIVLPKIKTIIIEEDVDESEDESAGEMTEDAQQKKKVAAMEPVKTAKKTKPEKALRSTKSEGPQGSHIKKANKVSRSNVAPKPKSVKSKPSTAQSAKAPRNKVSQNNVARSKPSQNKSSNASQSSSANHQPSRNKSTQDKPTADSRTAEVKLGDLKDAKSAQHLHSADEAE